MAKKYTLKNMLAAAVSAALVVCILAAYASAAPLEDPDPGSTGLPMPEITFEPESGEAQEPIPLLPVPEPEIHVGTDYGADTEEIWFDPYAPFLPYILPYVPPVMPDPEPAADLPDEEPPLAEVPGEEPSVTDLPDEEAPLADVPQTGSSAALYAALTVLSGGGLVWLGVKGKDEV